MRCYICDAIIDEPQFNRDHNSYDPCQECLDIIAEVFEEPDDKNEEIIEEDQEDIEVVENSS
jgi:hypothetical protein